MPKEFEAQNTPNLDELPKIERNTGHEQILGVANLTLEVIARHLLTVHEALDDRIDGRTVMEPLPGLSLVRCAFRPPALIWNFDASPDGLTPAATS